MLTLMKNIWYSTRTGLFPRSVHFPQLRKLHWGSLTFNSFGVFTPQYFYFMKANSY